MTMDEIDKVAAYLEDKLDELWLDASHRGDSEQTAALNQRLRALRVGYFQDNPEF